jgi:hypothetical protein
LLRIKNAAFLGILMRPHVGGIGAIVLALALSAAPVWARGGGGGGGFHGGGGYHGGGFSGGGGFRANSFRSGGSRGLSGGARSFSRSGVNPSAARSFSGSGSTRAGAFARTGNRAAAFAGRRALGGRLAGNALTSGRFAHAGWARNGPIGGRFWANRWAHFGWYRNWWRYRPAFGWWGPVFWPYAYYDLFGSVFWPYAYWPYFYDPFWYYGYPDLYAGIFWPYGYDDFVGPAPAVYGGGGYPGGGYAGGSYDPPGYAPARPRYASAPPINDVRSGASADVPATTQAAMGRYTEYCGQDSRDVAGVPVDDIQRAVSPTDAQRAALDDLGNASVQAAQIVKAACPRDVSLTPVGRMQAMEQRVQSMLDAAKVMRPALDKFYNMLTDEQKSRFNALGQQTQSQKSQSAGASAANGPSSPATNCSNRAIPDWPTAMIERSVRPTPAQQVNLTTLQTAAAKAKDILQASCPSEMPATALARISAIEQRLQTILAAVQTVRGPLNDFYSSLSDEQKAQFNAIGRTRPARQG